MSEAMVVIVLAAFLFGMIMGLALGKANKRGAERRTDD